MVSTGPLSSVRSVDDVDSALGGLARVVLADDKMIRRLHPNLKLTRTLTGRLATSGFPILGLPKHSEEGRRIRSLVRAPEGFVIYEIDYSQIELRTAAHISGDKGLINVFVRGDDLHAITAHLVLGAPKDKAKQDKSKHRLPAKAANFGYWMGLGAKGLTERVHQEGALEWSANCPGCKWFNAPHDDDCDSTRFFERFNQQFPGAPAYQQDRMAHARKTGKAYGLWGMEWSLPGVWSPHEEIAAQTERQAFALPIQEGAQRLIKQAMARVWRDLPKWRKTVEPILQIHDSLVFVVEKRAVQQFHAQTKQTMESIVEWSVPIVAEGSAGPTWLEQEDLK